MKKTVLVFGLIAGAFLSVMMAATVPFMDRIGFDRGLIIGYTTMVLAFMFIFFGIRSYRENVGGGEVSFGRAFAIGALITCVAAVCYVATWELIFFKLTPDHMEKYSAYVIAKERAAGASQQALDARKAEMQKFTEMYNNPLYNSAMSFVEPLPVGLIISLVSAGILRRRRQTALTAQ